MNSEMHFQNTALTGTAKYHKEHITDSTEVVFKTYDDTFADCGQEEVKRGICVHIKSSNERLSPNASRKLWR